MRTLVPAVRQDFRLEVGALHVVRSAPQVYRVFIAVGNVLTAIGCTGLLLSATGLIAAQSFAVGISSGFRVIGSLAIAGCLLSAIGYGVQEYFEK